MPLLQIKLLGDFSLVYDKQALTGVNTARLRSLLCYLMLHRSAPQSRQHLAFLLWPDSLEGQARTNLRQLLHHLRRSLPFADQFLDITTQTLQWRLDSNFQLDVAEFDRLANKVDWKGSSEDQSTVLSKLERAVSLYGGDLLPSCYDDWILPERDRLRGLFGEILERLVGRLEDQRQYQKAILYAERLLQQDPTSESNTLQLMRLNALNGERAKALRVYHRCVTVLKREFDISPGLAIQKAYEGLIRMVPSSTTETNTETSHPPVGLVDAFPLVGRTKEWEKLQSIWQSSVRGAPHFVSITGEAGIGKTRLAQELLSWAGRQGIASTATRSYHAEGKLAYAPVADWLRSGAINPALNQLAPVWLTEVTRLLPEMLLEHHELPRPAPLTEDAQRQSFFEALTRAVLIKKQPLILMIDDLQWCDRETHEWLHYLLRFDQDAPILIIATIRTGEPQLAESLSRLLLALRSSGQLSEINLESLNETETRRLAESLEDHPLDLRLQNHLYQETEGNPLFVVEYMRAGLSAQVSGQVSGHLDGQHTGREDGAARLPQKVQAIIQARLGQLSSDAMDLLRVASVIGRAFTMEVLSKASQTTEDALVSALDELWQRRMIRELHAESYDFSHDKIREVAYADISPMRRRFLHSRVAQALKTIHAKDLDLVSAAMAAHYEQADCPEQAILYYQWAAGVTQRIYANEETIRLFRRALSLLKTLPENQERAEKELVLQTSLGIPLVAIKGYGASEVMTALNRVQALCKQIGKPLSPPTLRALAIAHIVRGDLQQACELGDQLLRLAAVSQNTILHVEAHYVLGVSFFWLGEFPRARKHLEQAISFYRPDQHHSHVALYSQDAGVICLIRLSYLLWYLGQPEAAAIKCKEALDLAEALAHPFSLAYALNFATWLHHDCRDWQGARALNEKAAPLSREQRLGFLKPMGEIFQGYYLSQDGEIETGITIIRGALAEYEATGQDLYRPYALSLLAQVYKKAGKYEQALAALDEALSLANRSGLHFRDSALYRLKGEFLLQQGGQDGAESEALFKKALKVAQEQGAISLELPAAISLSRLWLSLKSDKKKAQAVKRLKKIVGFFNEGCETCDLREAKTLLEQLSKK